MTAQPAQDVRPVVVDELDELAAVEHHYVCCEDEDLALCGVDVSAHGWGDFGPDDPTLCRHCKRLFETDPTDVCSLCPRKALGQIDGVS